MASKNTLKTAKKVQKKGEKHFFPAEMGIVCSALNVKFHFTVIFLPLDISLSITIDELCTRKSQAQWHRNDHHNHFFLLCDIFTHESFM